MTRLKPFLNIALTATLMASVVTVHAEEKDDAKAGTDEGAKRVSAATIDFSVEPGLPFASLTTLGARIEAARQGADPVGLINAANELSVAEQVSAEKRASLTSASLTKEAVALAELRGASIELRAVAFAVKDSQQAEKLNQSAKVASGREQEAIEAAKAGERPKGIYGDLIFNNDSHEHVHVYYNGRYLGHADAHDHKHFHVHDHAHRHFFDVKAVGHHHTWSRHKDGDFKTYTWTIR
jgi:hypothetical protein